MEVHIPQKIIIIKHKVSEHTVAGQINTEVV